ncbi:MAG TPA: alpha/beta fold hydrolase [Pseudonocardiaceae bacterium]|nr:alpha/beta fold hydrolase [Pseudonocardiaceae bacterium]
MTAPKPSQLSPHRAARVDLPSRYGTVAALQAWAAGPKLGATALLLPGFTGSKEDFAPLVDPISDAGVEVIAIDLPGQYESEGPDDESAYRPEALGAVIADMIGKMVADGRRILLLGHSYGGLVARGAVLAEAPIVGLTLMDSGPGELPPGYRRGALDLAEPSVRKHGATAAQRLRETMDSTAPEWATTPDELKEFFRLRILRSGVAGLLGMSTALRTEPDRVAKLSRTLRAMGAPSLVVCGEADDAWSVASQRDMADRLDADFAVVPGAKHAPNTENPEALLGTLLPTWRSWLANP